MRQLHNPKHSLPAALNHSPGDQTFGLELSEPRYSRGQLTRSLVSAWPSVQLILVIAMSFVKAAERPEGNMAMVDPSHLERLEKLEEARMVRMDGEDGW